MWQDKSKTGNQLQRYHEYVVQPLYSQTNHELPPTQVHDSERASPALAVRLGGCKLASGQDLGLADDGIHQAILNGFLG